MILRVYPTLEILTTCIHADTLGRVPEVRKTEVFARWLDGLRDIQARARVQARIERLIAGNPGDVKPVGEGVSELRIDYGPGYRVYFRKRGRDLIILLAGGDKSKQASDIKNALRIARNT
jgi:putative addiction module killer protein